MEFTDIIDVEGSFTTNPQRYEDHRGFFQEHYNCSKYRGRVKVCQQISYSLSNKNVLRGIHTAPYGKLVQCVRGKIIDYVIDMRPSSPTYKKWKAVELEESIPRQLYIPPFCGHAFFSTEDNSLLVYCQEGCFDSQKEMNINPFDPELAIEWPECEEYIISDQDRNAPSEKQGRIEWEKRNMGL